MRAPEQLPSEWRATAASLRQYGAEQQAATLEKCASQLEGALDSARDALVPLVSAAERSGYNPDALRRLVRQQKLPAIRRGRRLFFRIGDLPQRPNKTVDAPGPKAYDPIADARRVAGRRTMGDRAWDANGSSTC